MTAEDSAYYDRGRQVLEPDEPIGEVAALADVVVTDVDDDELRGLGVPISVDGLRGGDRPQVLVTIRSFGSSGPTAGFRMTDLTEWASGGLAYGTRRPYPDDRERYVPVVPPGQQPQALAGLAAASGALAGWRWAEARREPIVVEVSVQEVMASMLHSIVPNFVWNGSVIGHPDTPTTAMGWLLPAADGDVYIRTVEAHQWEKLMTWMGDPDWAPLGATPELRMVNGIALRALLGDWTAPQARMDLLAEGQRRKVPIALPRSLDDVLAWQHLRARGAWVTVATDGGSEAPAVPVLEPPTWPVTRTAAAAELVAAWSAT